MSVENVENVLTHVRSFSLLGWASLSPSHDSITCHRALHCNVFFLNIPQSIDIKHHHQRIPMKRRRRNNVSMSSPLQTGRPKTSERLFKCRQREGERKSRCRRHRESQSVGGTLLSIRTHSRRYIHTHGQGQTR